MPLAGAGPQAARVVAARWADRCSAWGSAGPWGLGRWVCPLGRDPGGRLFETGSALHLAEWWRRGVPEGSTSGWEPARLQDSPTAVWVDSLHL